MKILVVHPGASWSVADVWSGLFAALRNQGHELIRYNLDGRIESAGAWLSYQWRRAGRPTSKPTEADVIYLASFELPYRALRTGVDWVLVISAMYVHPDALLMCRRAGIRVGLLLTESPYDDAGQARVASLADVCWTNERTSVDYLRQFNPHTFYLPHAYDPERHHPGRETDPGVPAHDVVFVGTMFQERIRLLEAVNWEGIDLGLYGSFDLMGSRHRLRRYVRGGITDNRRAAALYRRAQVGLNLYRTSKGFGRNPEMIDRAESLNPRALELAACGVFHLSDYRAEVEEVFGALVPTFTGAGQLEAQIRHWLPRDLERRQIEQQLPRAVADRSFDAMATQVVSDVERSG